MYSIHYRGEEFPAMGYASEAEAIRAAFAAGDPEARIEWETEREDLGTARQLAEELDLDID